MMLPAHVNVFTLPVWIELGAVLCMAMTAGIAAIRRGYDVVGVMALALLTSMGGGFIRDGVFIQQGPPAATTDARYIYFGLIGAFLGVLLGERVDRFRRVIAFYDAVGLGAFAVFGVQKALLAGMSAPAAVLVGVINAIGGGLLRDIVTKEEPLIFRPGQFYALVALFAAVAFIFLTAVLRVPATLAGIITIVVTLLFRGAAIIFNWKTSPFYPPLPPPPSAGGAV